MRNPQSPTPGPSASDELPRRRFLAVAAAIVGAVAWASSAPALAVSGARVDVTVIDRDTASPLAVYEHRGRSYVAGRPRARYAIRITNRTGERILAVMSVDGVNIVTGQTASWDQGGYVLGPWESYDITGWRKSEHEVAAFEFTALPDSYAARTGRPDDVGVIGVAVFEERIARRAPAPPAVNRFESPGPAAGAAAAPRDAMREKSAAEPRPWADAAERSAQAPAAPRLGTGYGARESSYATTTTFVRRSSKPVEVVSIQYDRHENLVRAGVIPSIDLARPSPFPQSARNTGFVPDPPTQ
jgi:hypothetical protein